MNRYIYSWLSVKDNYPSIQTLHHNTTFAENEQEAETYAKEKIQEFMDQFNTKTSATTKGHVEEFVLVSTEEVKKIEVPKISEE